MLKILRYLQKNLLITYLCKYLNIEKLKGYPIIIIPKTRYKLEIDLDKLFAENEVYLLRKSDLKTEDTFKIYSNGVYTLNDDAISLNRIINLSLNIIGGSFKPKHSKYTPKNKGSEIWKGDKIRISDYKDAYVIDKPKGDIFLKANNLHNKSIPYRVTTNHHLHKEIEKFERAFGKKTIVSNIAGQNIELKGKMKIKHVPVNLNYWHAELKLETYKEPLERYKSNQNIKALLNEVFTNWIKVNSKPNINGKVKRIKSIHYREK
jgi:hypothetical protein